MIKNQSFWVGATMVAIDVGIAIVTAPLWVPILAYKKLTEKPIKPGKMQRPLGSK